MAWYGAPSGYPFHPSRVRRLTVEEPSSSRSLSCLDMLVLDNSTSWGMTSMPYTFPSLSVVENEEEEGDDGDDVVLRLVLGSTIRPNTAVKYPDPHPLYYGV